MLDAIRTAGAMLRRRAGRRFRVQHKSSWSDLVTEVDRSVEQTVRQTILRRFPDHAFLGEEEGGGFDAEYTWVLDPLDGTTNFVHTLPNFVCSLACYRGQEPQVAAVYDPSRQELFTARRGAGAALNGVPIQVDRASRLQEALIGTNLMWDMREDRFAHLPGLQQLGRHVRGIRSLGAAALELAYVACGRLSGFAQYRLGPWDFAAGALLVKEAGGTVSQLDGRPLTPDAPCSVVASNGKIHPEMLRHLRHEGI